MTNKTLRERLADESERAGRALNNLAPTASGKTKMRAWRRFIDALEALRGYDDAHGTTKEDK